MMTLSVIPVLLRLKQTLEKKLKVDVDDMSSSPPCATECLNKHQNFRLLVFILPGLGLAI